MNGGPEETTLPGWRGQSGHAEQGAFSLESVSFVWGTGVVTRHQVLKDVLFDVLRSIFLTSDIPEAVSFSHSTFDTPVSVGQ